MPRTVNEEAQAAKRSEILDVMLRLIYTKGYEQTVIQDILRELKISKGAFYHYFDSKTAVLEALIDRLQEETLQVLRPVVADPGLGALEKLQRYFDTGVRWKTERRAFLTELLRVWYADHNAIVRQKLWASLSRRAMPLMEAIVEQGVREGVLSIRFPGQVGAIVLALFMALGDGFAALLLEPPRGDERERAAGLVAAHNDALERLLGAPAGSISLMDGAALDAWFGGAHAADPLRGAR